MHNWVQTADNYQHRVDTFTAAHRERANRGESHPVWDFLFSYYSLRPRQLRVWHPGYGVTLTGSRAAAYRDRTGYIEQPDGVTVGAEHLQSRMGTVRFVTSLLRATAGRQPQLNCFGMHEWAMVYRSDTPRHDGVPLRLGTTGTDAVVESVPLRCSHFDAYRFFTKAAAPRNRIALTRETQVQAEQPGCIHAAMDLYKWSYKLLPLIDSELVMDCLELAAHAREVDMRASPYDLRAYGFEPIRVEEPAGRAEYVRQQTQIAERAAALRTALLRRCEQLANELPVLPAGKMIGFS